MHTKEEYEAFLKEIKDSGLHTVVKVAGNGALANEALAFNKELEKEGYCLTTYYGINFSRCWGIYDKTNGRPRKVKDCALFSTQYFRPERRITIKCGGCVALEKLKKDFSKYIIMKNRK